MECYTLSLGEAKGGTEETMKKETRRVEKNSTRVREKEAEGGKANGVDTVGRREGKAKGTRRVKQSGGGKGGSGSTER